MVGVVPGQGGDFRLGVEVDVGVDDGDLGGHGDG